MTAPTEQEIREAIAAAAPNAGGTIGDRAYEYVNSLTDLWPDLRPSEKARLYELRDAVDAKMDAMEPEILARIRDLVVEAAMTFAAEYPDSPRKPQLIPA